MPALVGALVVVGMVLVVPLGLRLLDTPGLDPLRRVWPALGALAGVALLLPRGPLAGALVGPYAVACVAAALLGLRRLVRRRSAAVGELAAFAALGFLPVAASGLLPERLGVHFLGYAATHGVLNALGVALAGLLGWHRLEPRPL